MREQEEEEARGEPEKVFLGSVDRESVCVCVRER